MRFDAPFALASGLFTLGLLAAATAAQAQASAFQPDPQRAPETGSTWTYSKSNRDGSNAWTLVMHVVSPTHIEVVKTNRKAAYVEVHAQVDLATAMPVRLQQWNLECGQRLPSVSAEGDTTDGRSTVRVHLAQGMRLAVQAPGPLHMWGFDLTGFALIAPYLRQPAAAFELQFADPNQPGDGQPVKVAAARFEPQGQGEVQGQTATRYRLSGPLFGALEGSVWLSPKGELLQAEHGLRTSTDWRDWKLTRQKAERLDRIAWERLKLQMQQHSASAQAGDPDCKG